jgi:hypothetical protein
MFISFCTGIKGDFIFWDSRAVLWEPGVKIEDLVVSLFAFLLTFDEIVSSYVFNCYDFV